MWLMGNGRVVGQRGEREAYSVCTSVFLLSADDGAGALGGVEGGVAFDDSLAIDGAASRAGFAADASDVIPVLVGHGVWCV